jgi:hypothetical protein
MAEVTSVSGVVAQALTGVASSFGDSSLRRVVAGVDAIGHNLIDGAANPMTKRVIKERSYQHTSCGISYPFRVLNSQQLQVARTSTDTRTTKVLRDSVGLLNRAGKHAEALQGKFPDFEEEGAVHLRLTFSAPVGTELYGFTKKGVKCEEGPAPDGATGLESLERTDSMFSGAAESLLAHSCDSSADESSDSSSDGESASSDSSSEASSTREVPGAGVLAWMDDDDPHPLSQLGDLLEDCEDEEAPAALPSLFVRCTDCGLRKCKRPEWVDFGKARGYFSRTAKRFMEVANPTGARTLCVIDVVLPNFVYTMCLDGADSLVSEDKPAKNLTNAKAVRAMRKHINKAGQEQGHHIYNYLQTITQLTIMALMMDHGESGTSSCHILGYSDFQPVYTDFYSSTQLEEKIDELKEAKEEAGHPTSGIVRAVPAPVVQGTLNPGMVLVETDELDDYALVEKKPTIGAIVTGVDLLGKGPPNDHKDPMNYIGALFRHVGDSTTPVCEGTPFEYNIVIDRSTKAKLNALQDRVWDDLTEAHLGKFAEMLKDENFVFNFDFYADGKPGAYDEAKYDAAIREQMSNEAFFADHTAMNDVLAHCKETEGIIADIRSRVTPEQLAANRYHRKQMHWHEQWGISPPNVPRDPPEPCMEPLRATANLKRGEDSQRSRAVITPGICGSEALSQSRTSPAVKAIECLHGSVYNHTNLKGLTEETKRIKYADFLRSIPKGALVFGTDKSKNDACFREAVWRKCVKYLARMCDLFGDAMWTDGYVFAANESTASDSFPAGLMKLKYWAVKMTPLLCFLMSGIGPTSLFNRLESQVENGVAVLEIYKDAEYLKWLHNETHGTVSTHPEWNQHPRPHMADLVSWEPLAPKMVVDEAINVPSSKLTDEQIVSRHIGLNEGDDQVHAFIPPPTWDLPPRAAVLKYTSILSKMNGFIFEAALPGTEGNLMGRNAMFEMCSGWVGFPNANPDESEVVVIIPKVLKALRKIPQCTISTKHTLIRDDAFVVTGVVHDASHWSLALTRYYALAIVNKESLGVRGLFLSHGDRAYDKLCTLVGENRAYTHAPIYGDRDPERRQIEEVADTTFTACGAMRDRAHEVIHDVSRPRVLRRCAEAWVSELPELAINSLDDIQAALVEFDSVSLGTEITDQMVDDPMLLWLELDVGCLQAPLVFHASANLSKIAQQYRSSNLKADSQQTVLLARQLAGIKAADSTKKGGGSDVASGKTAAAPAAKSGKKGITNKPVAGPARKPSAMSPNADTFTPKGPPPGLGSDKQQQQPPQKGNGKGAKGKGKANKGKAKDWHVQAETPSSSSTSWVTSSHMNWKLKTPVAASGGGGQ